MPDSAATYLADHKVQEKISEAVTAALKARPEDPVAFIGKILAGGGVKKVTILATSSNMMGEHSTGAWSEEITGPYYTFLDAGCKVMLASTGWLCGDPKSTELSCIEVHLALRCRRVCSIF